MMGAQVWKRVRGLDRVMISPPSTESYSCALRWAKVVQGGAGIMGTLTPSSHHMWLLWKPYVVLALLLLHLCCPEAADSCNILRCNSNFVAATLDLGSSGGGGAGGGAVQLRDGVNVGYCRALRSYATCTRRTARSCRGDLAYHSAAQGIQDLLIQHSCPRGGPTTQPRTLPQAPPPGDTCSYEKRFLVREGRLPDYVHCGVFGDPHVRTFNNDFQTCAVRGAWPLIDNAYLYVQVTSTPVRASAAATALTKVTIIFKSWPQCTEQQLYQAELDNVPAAFADGSVSGGQRRGRRRLLIHSQDLGRHAAIYATHIGTILVVRQNGRSLGVSVRTPRVIAESFSPEQDLQLCVWGCPLSQRLSAPVPSSAGGAAGAQAHCAALLPVQDIYQQACVFDLLATGDRNASQAAMAALADARRMMGDRLHLTPTAPASSDQPQTAGTQALLLLLLLLLSCLGDQ